MPTSVLAAYRIRTVHGIVAEHASPLQARKTAIVDRTVAAPKCVTPREARLLGPSCGALDICAVSGENRKSKAQRVPHPASPPPVACVLSIGDELLSGDTVNTNAAFLGTRARALGIELRRVVVLRDRMDEIVAAVHDAVRHGAIVLVSGGLGPTTDDLTTAAIAAAVGDELVRDPAAVERLTEKFQRLGRAMPEANLKQADRPASATWLANPIGSAEGFAVDHASAAIFVMPGVPREMHKMMVEQVEPRLRERHALAPTRRRMYRTLGMGESALAERIEPVIARARTRSPGLAAMFVHYRASMPEVFVVLEAVHDEHGNAATDAELASFDAELAAVLAPALYGIGEASLATRIVTAATKHGRRIAFAESCTAGMSAALLAAVPGASLCLDGAIVAYDNRIKRELLGVDGALLDEHGAVSEPVARAMADGGRRSLGSDLCVAITGIAGPGGGTREKPVGTVCFAVSDGNETSHLRLHLRGDRGTLQRGAALWAHKLLWDRLHAAGLAPIDTCDPIADE
jgi:nicotinamide-nucleotide amidase